MKHELYALYAVKALRGFSIKMVVLELDTGAAVETGASLCSGALLGLPC